MNFPLFRCSVRFGIGLRCSGLTAMIVGFLLCQWFTLPLLATPLQSASLLPYQQGASSSATQVGLSSAARWSSNDGDASWGVAWGDVDGDGDLDLAVGNSGTPNKLYRNENGVLNQNAIWQSNDVDATTAVEWGDIDGDGDLDLAVANFPTENTSGANKVYLNANGSLQSTATWVSADNDFTLSIAWGDMDGDGDLDLAAGNARSANKVYQNINGVLQVAAAWTSEEVEYTSSVAWGDMDGDGDLDLAVSNEVDATNGSSGSVKIYINQNGMLEKRASWVSSDVTTAHSVAWGDVDGDGDLDLAIGSSGVPNRLYQNNNGVLPTTAAWISEDNDGTLKVVWGDVDNDGDLDLAAANAAVANVPGPNVVYINEGGALQTKPGWISDESIASLGAAWGDVDGDGDLDLAVTNLLAPNHLYLNEQLPLSKQANWNSGDSDNTRSSALGDMDGDGDLDLAVGNYGAPIKVYVNEQGIFQPTASWTSSDVDGTIDVAWGDVDGDGDLDLAVSNSVGPNKLYLNQAGLLEKTAAWSALDAAVSTSLAWGDVDGDGDLDLAVGNLPSATSSGANQLYLNENGLLQRTPAWTSNDNDQTFSIAWGDVDNDGDLDLAAGNNSGANKLYRNDQGRLQPNAVWLSVDIDQTRTIAWGDMDGDGDLDLAAGNWAFRSNRVYLNEGGVLQATAGWTSNDTDFINSVTWGDIDGDGDLDLVAAGFGENLFLNKSVKVYLNQGKRLHETAAWSSNDSRDATDAALGDIDGNGNLDLVITQAPNSSTQAPGVNRLYLNAYPAHPSSVGEAVAMALDLYSTPVDTFNHQSTLMLAPANQYAIPAFRQSGAIPIRYYLFHPDGEPMRAVRAFYSLNGGDDWLPALATADTITTGLTTAPYPTKGGSNTHSFTWDVLKSGFFGQSDNVVLRIEALPNLKPWPNNVPGPFQRPFVAAQTYPFRVRGNQVRVVDAAANKPVTNTLVYRLPAAPTLTAGFMADGAGIAFRTDMQGYLQGRGLLTAGDQLVALQPIAFHEKYTVYQTSATPILTGLEMFTVQSQGIQQVTVSAAHPLILFNLRISLEWDARKDNLYLEQLRFDLQRTTELLYDWSNGQAALGTITIYHDKAAWHDADIRIHASNRLRPHATVGGVVSGPRLATITRLSAHDTPTQTTYLFGPGHVEMSATWSRYGEPGESLSEDWARTLAHELGHYLFFLHDNYIGLNNDQIIRVESCPGVMSDPYTELISEFHPVTNWTRDCTQTFSHQLMGRSDWETITAFYPWLHGPTAPINNLPDAGPNTLPLALMQLQFVAPAEAVNTFDVPTFSLVQASGERYLASSRARAFLFTTEGLSLIDLGAPRRDRVQAWNARPGDRLCVYDIVATDATDLASTIAGCQVLTVGDDKLVLSVQPHWRPDVIITPLDAKNIGVRVEGVPAGLLLKARLYAADETTTASILPELSLALQADGAYTGAIVLAQSTPQAYLHIYEAGNPTRGIVTEYTLGGAPVLSLRDGDLLSLSNGDVLTLSDGSVLSLSDGDVLVFSQGTVLIRLANGEVLSLSDGDVLSLSDGDIVRLATGEVLPLSDGDVLSLSDGNILIVRTTGEVLSLSDGDVLSLSDGDVLSLSDGDVLSLSDGDTLVLSSSIWLGNGSVLSLSDGDVLSLSDGDVLSLSDGNTLLLSGGQVLSLSDGDVLSLSDGNIRLNGGGEVLSLSDGDAPVRSGDGHVTLYGSNLGFNAGEFYTLQPVAQLPAAPKWATVSGQGYRITASSNAPSLAGLSISFNYLGRDVDNDNEKLLRIYFWNGVKWQELATSVDTYHNIAVATAQGVGIYALMYSIDIALYGPGWNLVGYPVAEVRMLQDALSSIDGFYTTVFSYDASIPEPFERWRFYDTAVPDWVNSLHELKPGLGYWILATENVTLKLADTTVVGASAAESLLPSPPALYYHTLEASNDFVPAAGLQVQAWVADKLCGAGQTREVNGKIVFTIAVYADEGQFVGCGALGRTVQFTIGSYRIGETLLWNNRQVNQVTGAPAGQEVIFLPVVRR